jgi:beta-phosphoglucomutase-like phosphatase (HAD superfamily)
MPLDCLIFDVDGTLAETEEQHRLSFNAAFAAADLPWHWDIPLYTRLLRVTGGKERIAHFISAYGATPVLDDQAIARLHAAKTAHYAAAVEAGAITLRPGIRRLLDEARQEGVAVAIATTTSPANVDALLRVSLGPQGASRFAAIAAGDCVTLKKPAPDVYHQVLYQVGIAAANAVAIEDTRNGLLSARGAGIPVVITRSRYGGDDDFDGAIAVVDHLGDPGQPCRDLNGATLDSGMITLAWLRRRQEG